MTYRNLTVAVVSAALLWSATDVVAQPRGGRRMARRPGIAKALELTAEQQEKLKALRTEEAKTKTRLGADLKIAQLELRSLMGQTAPSAADVKARVADVSRIRSQVFSARIEGRLAKAAVFTPEQKEKMKGLRQGRGRAEGRAMRGGGRQMKGRGRAMMGQGRRGPGRGGAMAKRGRGPAGGRGMHRPNMAKALELTAVQQEKLKALNLSNAKAMARLQADQKIAMLDLRSAMGQAAPGDAGVKALVAKVNQARGQILTARIDQQLAKSAVFTPEQKEKMKQLRQQMKMGPGPEGMMGPGPGMRGRGRHMKGMMCPGGPDCPECPGCRRQPGPMEAPATPKQ